MKSKADFSLVFMGTPEFAKTNLERLYNYGYKISAVITAPDKPAGRGKLLTESNVKQYAKSVGLPILQPTNLKNEHFIDNLQTLGADLFVVVAFRMLPDVVWAMPPMGTINLHASLLPDYRGAAPINHALINGESVTGLTTFFISREIDTGHIIAQSKTPILPQDNAGTLLDKMMVQGADLLIETIEKIRTGTVSAVPQAILQKADTFQKLAPKIFKENSKINWNKSALEIHNFVRGLSPVPTAWTELRHRESNKIFTLKIFETEFEFGTQAEIGTIIASAKQFGIATHDGVIYPMQIRLEGKKSLQVKDFLNGTRISDYEIII